MTDDKPELTSEELLRQSREAFGVSPAVPPQNDGAVDATPDDPGTPPPAVADESLSSSSLLGSSPSPAMPPEALPPRVASQPAPPSAMPPALSPTPPSATPPPVAPPSSPVPPATPPPAVPPTTPSSAMPPPAVPPATPSSAMPPRPGGGPSSAPPVPNRSGSGVEYYPTEDFKPQSFGAGGASSASSMGAPAPPPAMGFPQQQRGAPMAPPRKASRNIPWRLVIGGGVVAIFLIIGAIAGRGTTTASALDVGDCFEDPGFGDFSSVDDQDCGEPHEIQIYARLKNVPAAVINNSTSTGPESLGFRCEEALFEILDDDILLDPSIVIPDDTTLGWFSDNDVRRQGDVLCAIESPSGGLVGSVVP